jgi:hypothetical protein
MRFNFTLARLVLIFRFSAIMLLSGTAFSQDKPNGNDLIIATLAKRDISTQVLPFNTTRNWYSQAVANLEDREYFIRTQDKPGVFGAVNHAQHLGYLFTGKGYAVTNFNEDGSTKGIWNTRFLFSGIGRKGRIRQMPLSHANQKGDQALQYDYRDYTITYDNRKQGMEQSFLIKKRPSGKKDLQIVIGLDGDLAARTGEDNQLVLYTPGHPSAIKLVYDQLKVWDREKKSLPAHLQVTGAHRLVLTVDDRAAVYPITVDPLNHTPNKILTGDNILGTSLLDASVHLLYGFSVSGAGDVNGDGTDDVIVGSPTFTKITAITSGTLSLGVGVTGAAFIYYGAPAVGPATTPSQVLQPTGLATGALFGYSVSTAGKFDGTTTRSGVVVGAPADAITLTVAGLPAQVAAGKVYVYSGNVFTADINTMPAPSATLSLSSGDFSGLLIVAPPNPLFGFSVSDAGNLDGDAFDDIVAGTPYFTNVNAFGPLLAGRVDIFKGGATGIVTTSAGTINGQTATSLFGFSVSSAGKVKGSGAGAFNAIIAGAPGALIAIGQMEGHAYLFYGKSGGITATSAATADQVLGGGSGIIASLFGFSVSGAGDVDGDGFDDVIVGEPLRIDNGVAAGRASIFYGSATGIPATAGTILRSPRSPSALSLLTGPNLLFGYSVGKAGNVTGDAAGEVLVGEPGSLALSNPAISTLLTSLTGTSTLSGQAYVFEGTLAAHMPNNSAPFLTIADNNPGGLVAANLLGASVHYAGDVNHDGSPDFIIGGPSGILDLGLNTGALPGGFTPGSGLIVSANSGGAYLYFGFTGPLPVNFLSFTATAEKTDVLLYWSTAQEQNSDHFEIERSSDNSNFVSIGEVTAAHNSSSQTSYSFTDLSPVSGNNFYRLKEVDLDGNSIYSKVVSVNFGGPPQNGIAVYPNPAHESFQLLFKNMQTGRYEMNLLSPVGQVIQSRSFQVSNSASYAEIVPLNSGLAEGTYIIRLVDQQQHVFISKVVIR